MGWESYSLPLSNHQRLLIFTKENHMIVNDLTGFVILLARSFWSLVEEKNSE